MKASLFTLALVSLAGMLAAAETNLYLNPKFEKNKGKNLTIACHWHQGKLSIDGDYKGAPAVKLESVKTKWGYEVVFSLDLDSRGKFQPGKYTFSVWCKIDRKPPLIYVYHTNFPAGQNKSVREARKDYKGKDLPAAGEWKQLVLDFEVKPDATRNRISYALYSREADGSMPVWFADPKIVPAEKK